MNGDISICSGIITDLNLCSDERCPGFIFPAFETDESAAVYDSALMESECFTDDVFVQEDQLAGITIPFLQRGDSF